LPSNPQKKLSIIIPLYIVEKYVTNITNSIITQTFDGLEVILIDDGSTDSSLNVFTNNLSTLAPITISQPNKGLSAARNAGILKATGEYLLFLDADDFLLPNALKNIIEMLETDKPDVLFGRYLRWNPRTGFIKSPDYNYQPPNDNKKRTEYILSALPESSWNAWRYVCRRSLILEKELFFEVGILCEDVPWTLRLLENVDSISFLKTPFYAYYQHRPGSIMSSVNSKRLIDLNATVLDLLNKYKNRPVLCRSLVKQSFYYINEYCKFKKYDRIKVLESYRSVLPLYKNSNFLLHQTVGKCHNFILFYGVSIGLFASKIVYKRYKDVYNNMHKAIQ